MRQANSVRTLVRAGNRWALFIDSLRLAVASVACRFGQRSAAQQGFAKLTSECPETGKRVRFAIKTYRSRTAAFTLQNVKLPDGSKLFGTFRLCERGNVSAA